MALRLLARAAARRLAGLLLPLAATALLLAACDETSDASGAEGAKDSGIFLELLRLMPDDPEVRAGVSMGDVARTRGVLDIDSPQVGAGEQLDADVIIEYLMAFGGPGVPDGFRGAPPQLFHLLTTGLEPEVLEGVHASLGLSLLDVDQWIRVSGPPPRERSAVRGDFDADYINARIDACAECPTADVEDRSDARIYAWGEDFQTDAGSRYRPPLYDQLGRGGRLAVTENWLAHAYYTDGVREMVDAAEGTSSLADDDDFRLAALGMSRLGALAAWITSETEGPHESFRGNRPEVEAAWEPEADDTLLRPYAVAAIGPGWEDDAPYTAIVLVHESDAEAQENAERLEDRLASARYALQAVEGDTWRDAFDDIEVEADGRVLRAKLHGFALAPLGLGGSNILLMEPILQQEWHLHGTRDAVSLSAAGT